MATTEHTVPGEPARPRPARQPYDQPGVTIGAAAVAAGAACALLLDFAHLPRLQPLTGLLQHLEETLERPVIDRTGLKGNYDIELSYLDASLADPTVAAQSPSTGQSLFIALQEQLGMKLESARGPVDVLVIDSVSEPN